MTDPRELVDRVHRGAATVVGALILGVVMFAGIAFAVGDTGVFPADLANAPFRWGMVALAAVILGAARPLSRKVASVPRGADAETTAAAWMRSRIVGSALREAVGMLGGVMILLGDMEAGLALAAASIGVMLLAFPRKSDLEERVQRSSR